MPFMDLGYEPIGWWEHDQDAAPTEVESEWPVPGGSTLLLDERTGQMKLKPTLTGKDRLGDGVPDEGYDEDGQGDSYDEEDGEECEDDSAYEGEGASKDGDEGPYISDEANEGDHEDHGDDDVSGADDLIEDDDMLDDATDDDDVTDDNDVHSDGCSTILDEEVPGRSYRQARTIRLPSNMAVLDASDTEGRKTGKIRQEALRATQESCGQLCFEINLDAISHIVDATSGVLERLVDARLKEDDRWTLTLLVVNVFGGLGLGLTASLFPLWRATKGEAWWWKTVTTSVLGFGYANATILTTWSLLDARKTLLSIRHVALKQDDQKLATKAAGHAEGLLIVSACLFLTQAVLWVPGAMLSMQDFVIFGGMGAFMLMVTWLVSLSGIADFIEKADRRLTDARNEGSAPVASTVEKPTSSNTCERELLDERIKDALEALDHNDESAMEKVALLLETYGKDDKVSFLNDLCDEIGSHIGDLADKVRRCEEQLVRADEALLKKEGETLVIVCQGDADIAEVKAYLAQAKADLEREKAGHEDIKKTFRIYQDRVADDCEEWRATLQKAQKENEKHEAEREKLVEENFRAYAINWRRGHCILDEVHAAETSAQNENTVLRCTVKDLEAQLLGAQARVDAWKKKCAMTAEDGADVCEDNVEERKARQDTLAKLKERLTATSKDAQEMVERHEDQLAQARHEMAVRASESLEQKLELQDSYEQDLRVAGRRERRVCNDRDHQAAELHKVRIELQAQTARFNEACKTMQAEYEARLHRAEQKRIKDMTALDEKGHTAIRKWQGYATHLIAARDVALQTAEKHRQDQIADLTAKHKAAVEELEGSKDISVQAVSSQLDKVVRKSRVALQRQTDIIEDLGQELTSAEKRIQELEATIEGWHAIDNEEAKRAILDERSSTRSGLDGQCEVDDCFCCKQAALQPRSGCSCSGSSPGLPVDDEHDGSDWFEPEQAPDDFDDDDCELLSVRDAEDESEYEASEYEL